jgi:hypothetical protein
MLVRRRPLHHQRTVVERVAWIEAFGAIGDEVDDDVAAKAVRLDDPADL